MTILTLWPFVELDYLSDAALFKGTDCLQQD